MKDKLEPQKYYEEIMAAVVVAIESEQPGGPAPFSLETENRVDFVSRLVQEALGLQKQN